MSLWFSRLAATPRPFPSARLTALSIVTGGLLQGFLAVHHAGAGAVSQFLNHVGGNRHLLPHNLYLSAEATVTLRYLPSPPQRREPHHKGASRSALFGLRSLTDVGLLANLAVAQLDSLTFGCDYLLRLFFRLRLRRRTDLYDSIGHLVRDELDRRMASSLPGMT